VLTVAVHSHVGQTMVVLIPADMKVMQIPFVCWTFRRNAPEGTLVQHLVLYSIEPDVIRL